MGLKCFFNQETGERSVAGFRSHKNPSCFGMLWKLIALKHTWQRFRLSTSISFLDLQKDFRSGKWTCWEQKQFFFSLKATHCLLLFPAVFLPLCCLCVFVEPGIYPAILQRSNENLPFGPQQNTSRINRCLVNVPFVKDMLEFTGLKLISSGWSGESPSLPGAMTSPGRGKATVRPGLFLPKVWVFLERIWK